MSDLYLAAKVAIVTEPGELHKLGSPRNKPVLRIQPLPDGPVIVLSLAVAEMIGGAAKGARERWESMA